MTDFLVSIINYKTAELTLECLRSVVVALKGRDGHVAVVDNASEDGSLEKIRAWLEEHPNAPVTLIASQTNSGFSSGHNQAIRAFPDVRHYLILNSDAVIAPDFFDAMEAKLEQSPKAGLYAPRITTENGEVQDSLFRFPGVVSEFIRGVNSGPVTNILSRYVVSLDPDPDPKDIRWASFACILLSGDMVRSIGDMDEGYFLYFEDVEYCLRAWRQGWKIETVPAAMAVHYCGGSGPVRSLQESRARLPQYYYRSRTRFFFDAIGPHGPLLTNLAWLLGRGIAYLRPLFGKPLYPTIKNEARDIWIGILQPNKVFRP